MARLRHIAIQVPDPQKAADFYMRVFGMRKVGETDWENARGVYLTDGVMNLALLDYKTEYAAGERGCNFVGLHHIGFWVDEINQACQDVKDAGGEYFLGDVPEQGNKFYEVKYFDPNGVMIDLTDRGWSGTVKDAVAADDTVIPELRNPELKAKR